MDTFFENLADILSNLPSNPMAIVSLVVIAIGLLAYVFFAKENIWARLGAFVLCIIGAGGIVIQVLNYGTSTYENADPAITSPQDGSAGAEDDSAHDVDEDLEEPVGCSNLGKISYEEWSEICQKD